jgi:O-antigen/teichoic acid export membrane protein
VRLHPSKASGKERHARRAPDARRGQTCVGLAAVKRLRRLLRTAGWGVFDQILISVVNFLTLFLIARSVEPGAFGAFSLIYGAMLIANYGQLAFITQPHNVIAASLRDAEYRVYTRSLLVAQLVVLLALVGITAAVAVVAHGVGSRATFLLLVAVIPALPLWQLQEFVRRVLYTERRQAAAFGNDLLSYGAQGVLVGMLAAVGRLTAPAALYAAALTSAAGCLLGFAQIRESVRGATFSRGPVSESVAFGKWLAASIAAHWTSTQGYLYLAAAVLGVAVTGALRAVQLVLAPLHVLMFSLSTMLPIRLSVLLANADKEVAASAFQRNARLAFRLTAPIVVTYCVCVALFANHIIRYAYGSTYSAYGRVLVIFAGYYLLLYLAQFAATLLTAQRRTDWLFLGNALAALVTVAAAWPLMRAFGAEGAAFLLVVSAGVLTIVLWRPWHGSFEPAPAHAGDAPGPVEIDSGEDV